MGNINKIFYGNEEYKFSSNNIIIKFELLELNSSLKNYFDEPFRWKINKVSYKTEEESTYHTFPLSEDFDSVTESSSRDIILPNNNIIKLLQNHYYDDTDYPSLSIGYQNQKQDEIILSVSLDYQYGGFFSDNSQQNNNITNELYFFEAASGWINLTNAGLLNCTLGDYKMLYNQDKWVMNYIKQDLPKNIDAISVLYQDSSSMPSYPDPIQDNFMYYKEWDQHDSKIIKVNPNEEGYHFVLRPTVSISTQPYGANTHIFYLNIKHL